MELAAATALIETNIRLKLLHQDYDRVTQLATLYYRLITGDQADKLLIQFVQREDAESFIQRCKITQLITKALCGGVQKVFNKASRTKASKRLDIKDALKKEAVEAMINNFWGSIPDVSGLERFMQTRFSELSFVDPNAWVVLEFANFNNLIEYAQPRPFEVKAAQAINFAIDNDVTKWLLVRQDITQPVLKPGVTPVQYAAALPEIRTQLLTVDGRIKNGARYTIYTDTFCLVYEQINKKFVDAYLAANPGALIKDLSEKGTGDYLFIVKIYNPNFGFVPAFRVGYLRDEVADGRTFVSPIHPAIEFLMKSVKSVSEHDLTMSLHTFPQKVQYVQRCRGYKEDKCNAGVNLEGRTCRACQGAGYIIHKTAQDSITLPMPDDPLDMLDLTKIIHYAAPPADLIKFMDEYVDRFEAKIHKAVFNSTVFIQDTVEKTATEQNMKMDSVYDTLAPFAGQLSLFYKFVANACVELAEVNEPDIKIAHSYPADFKLKTIPALIADLKDMNESGAPSFIIGAVNDDIASLLYSEDEYGMLRYKVQRSFNPFPDKTADEIALAVTTNYISDFNKVLYYNFGLIFAQIERDDPKFYDKSYKDQWQIVGEYVNELVDEMQQAETDRFNAQMEAQQATEAAGQGTGRFGAKKGKKSQIPDKNPQPTETV